MEFIYEYIQDEKLLQKVIEIKEKSGLLKDKQTKSQTIDAEIS